jgi:hypothetical protein
MRFSRYKAAQEAAPGRKLDLTEPRRLVVSQKSLSTVSLNNVNHDWYLIRDPSDVFRVGMIDPR